MKARRVNRRGDRPGALALEAAHDGDGPPSRTSAPPTIRPAQSAPRGGVLAQRQRRRAPRRPPAGRSPGQRLQLPVRAGLVRRVQPLLELLHVEPPLGDGVPQDLGDPFTLGVGGAQSQGRVVGHVRQPTSRRVPAHYAVRTLRRPASARVPHAPRTSSAITASMSGSRTDRSTSGYSAAIRATSGAADSRRRERQPLPRPLHLDRTRAAPVRRSAAVPAPGPPPASARSPPASCSPASAPSYISRPWSMTITRLHSCSMSVQVVRGQQHRRAPLGVHLAQELPHLRLGDHVEPDGRLVEVQHLGVVQQRRRDVAAHPLAEGELPHRHVQQVAQVQQFDAAVEVLAVTARPGSGTSGAPAGTSRISGRSHHRVVRCPKTTPIRLREPRALARRVDAGDPQPAAAGGEDAGQHLDRGGLAGAVRADVADHLAARHPEADRRPPPAPAAAPGAAGRPCGARRRPSRRRRVR